MKNHMNYGTQKYQKNWTKLRQMPSGLIPGRVLPSAPPRHFVLLILFATLFLSQACLAGRTPDPGSNHVGQNARDMAAIQKVIDAYQETWNRHDAHAFSLIFAPNAQFVNVRGITYPGGQVGIERAHKPLFVTMFKDSHVTTDRVQIIFLRPDVVSADVYWRMTGSTDRAGKPRGLVRGLRIMVLTKEGGDWRIAIFHNMETQGPAASQGRSNPPGSAAH